MKKLFFIGAVALVMASCTTYSYTSRSANIANDVKLMTTQTLVDVQVDFTKRVEAQSSLCATESEAMNEAKYNAIVNNKIDLVIDPIYKIEHQFRKVRVYLTGYAGYYVNPRTALDGVKQMEDVDKSTVEKYLLLNQTNEIAPYLYKNSDHITINHNGSAPKCDGCKTAPVVTSTPVEVAPTTTSKGTTSHKKK